MEDMCITVDDLLLEEDEVPPPAMSMSPGGGGSSSATTSSPTPPPPSGGGSEDDLRRGPWTVEEDALLIHHIAAHGEGRWNALARSAGLRRTGKSCRLRWLNYLRPDVVRGNITPREQLLILDLHSRWGNRWSKIAAHLPGRTDNEIKNYWRTRVQKHARQLRCDVSSARFNDVVRRVWMPRLVERIQAEEDEATAAGACGGGAAVLTTTAASAPPACQRMPLQSGVHGAEECYYYTYSAPAAAAGQTTPAALSPDDNASSAPHSSLTTDAASSSQAQGGGHHHYYSCYTATTPTNEGCGGGGVVVQCGGGGDASRPRATDGDGDVLGGSWSELLVTAGRDDDGDDSSMSAMIGLPDFGWFGDLEDSSSLWSLEDLCLHQLC